MTIVLYWTCLSSLCVPKVKNSTSASSFCYSPLLVLNKQILRRHSIRIFEARMQGDIQGVPTVMKLCSPKKFEPQPDVAINVSDLFFLIFFPPTDRCSLTDS
jgi:hypothetical protein